MRTTASLFLLIVGILLLAGGALAATSGETGGIILSIIGLPTVLVGFGIRRNSKSNEQRLFEQGKLVQCPYCKEFVKPEASICKHCHQPVSPESLISSKMRVSSKMRDRKVQQRKFFINLGLYILAFVILIMSFTVFRFPWLLALMWSVLIIWFMILMYQLWLWLDSPDSK